MRRYRRGRRGGGAATTCALAADWLVRCSPVPPRPARMREQQAASARRGGQQPGAAQAAAATSAQQQPASKKQKQSEAAAEKQTLKEAAMQKLLESKGVPSGAAVFKAGTGYGHRCSTGQGRGAGATSQGVRAAEGSLRLLPALPHNRPAPQTRLLLPCPHTHTFACPQGR